MKVGLFSVSLTDLREQLELICKKFREEIHHRLQNFSSTLKALEAYQIELKGTVKRQSMITSTTVNFLFFFF